MDRGGGKGKGGRGEGMRRYEGRVLLCYKNSPCSSDPVRQADWGVSSSGTVNEVE